MKPIIRVENISKKFLIGEQQKSNPLLREYLVDLVKSPFKSFNRYKFTENNCFWALRDISFEVKPGEVLGIIGRNGSGKSTLLKILSQITEPTTGRVELYGRIGSLLEVGTGFHPDLTGRENVFLNGAILGMKRREIARKFDEIVDFAAIDRFLDTPVKHYSSGMHTRLAFAVAAHLEPEILIVDEVLSVGDTKFQEKCLGKMEEIGEEGRTVLFVSHDMAIMRQLCRTAILLDKGIMLDMDEADVVLARYIKMNEEAVSGRIISEYGTELSDIHLRDLKTDDVTFSPIFNQSYQLNLQLKAHKPLNDVIIYCNLHDDLGNLVSVLSSFEEGIDPFYFDGSLNASFRLPELQLLPGRYNISLIVYGYSDEKNYLEADRCFSFEIQPAIVHNAASAYNKKYFGVLRVSDGCEISSDAHSNKFTTRLESNST